MPGRASIRLAAVAVIWGAACGRGGDGPRTIARAGADARLLGAAEGRAYWARGNELSWIDDALPAPQSLRIAGADWASRGTSIVETRRLFFVHHNKLEQLDIGAGSNPDVRARTFEAGEHPAGLVRQGDCAYVLDGDVECAGRGAVHGVPLIEGATCRQLAVPANGLQPLPFAADAQRFYWADQACPGRSSPPADTVAAIDRSTGAVTVLAPGEQVSGDLQLGTRGVSVPLRQ